MKVEDILNHELESQGFSLEEDEDVVMLCYKDGMIAMWYSSSVTREEIRSTALDYLSGFKEHER